MQDNNITINNDSCSMTLEHHLVLQPHSIYTDGFLDMLEYYSHLPKTVTWTGFNGYKSRLYYVSNMVHLMGLKNIELGVLTITLVYGSSKNMIMPSLQHSDSKFKWTNGRYLMDIEPAHLPQSALGWLVQLATLTFMEQTVRKEIAMLRNPFNSSQG